MTTVTDFDFRALCATLAPRNPKATLDLRIALRVERGDSPNRHEDICMMWQWLKLCRAHPEWRVQYNQRISPAVCRLQAELLVRQLMEDSARQDMEALADWC
ncbi:hypothetical protein LTR49_028157, partial [Elasticomyces elasticus]